MPSLLEHYGNFVATHWMLDNPAAVDTVWHASACRE
jgi:hypothetical protein